MSAATDVVLGLGEPVSAMVDLSFQSDRDCELARRVFVYNALVHYQLRVPVFSVVGLLRREADNRTLPGKLRYQVVPRRGKVEFTFEVVRLWRQPVKRFLAGPVGSLAVLAQMPGDAPPQRALPRVLHAIDERITAELPPSQMAELWTTIFLLAGLRLPSQVAVTLFQGVLAMKESSTYQYLIDERIKSGQVRGMKEGIHRGAMEEARRLIGLGRRPLGKPSASITKKLAAVDDLERFHRMSRRLLKAESWQELLTTP